jgi:hypothetical protein
MLYAIQNDRPGLTPAPDRTRCCGDPFSKLSPELRPRPAAEPNDLRR